MGERLSLGLGPTALAPHVDDLRKDFARFLRDVLQMSVRVVATRSYAQLYEQMTTGEVSVAWMPPAVFVRAHDTHDVRLMLSSVHSRASRYFGVLYVREDSVVEDVSDLRGSAVAWVDASSCAGYLFPRLAMAERGIEPRGFFGDEMGAGSHERAAEAVAERIADVGAGYAHELHDDSTEIEEPSCAWDHADVDVPMRPILRSRAIPNPVLCCAPTVALDLEETITERLLRAHEEKGAARVLGGLLQIRRFEKVALRDYDVVRAALNVTHSQLRRSRRG